MIEDLGIRDLGVIADATLPLGTGFTAVTGETGAGKTMVVEALGLLLGGRADSAVVRAGAKQAWVDARWRVPAGERGDRIRERLADAGCDLDDDELLLGRSVSHEGRSRGVAGGRSVPVGVLADLATELVVVHGQADQQRLRSTTAQRDALDRFAGAPCVAALVAYRDAYLRWQEATADLARLRADREARLREATDLRDALDALTALNPQPGEDIALAERSARLTHSETLRYAAAEAHDALMNDTDVVAALDLVDVARRTLERVAQYDAALAPMVDALASASFVLSDSATDLAAYLDGLDADAGRELAAVEERRAALAPLIRQHGSLDDALAFQASGGLRLVDLDGDDDRVRELEEHVGHLTAEVDVHADRLTVLRQAAAGALATAVTSELAALAMPHARLSVEVAQAEATVHGRDAVSILLAPHPGAEPRSVSRGASGGELSRVMLALEVVLAGDDPVPTFVFDEVDAGVGGAAAIEVGRRLARLATRSQVIVVTHLAQVAAFATNHLTVVKGTDGEVTASSVRPLHGAEREAEMARLLSGLAASESALEHARELLDMAARGRASSSDVG